MMLTKWQQPTQKHHHTLGDLIDDLPAAYAALPIVNIQLDHRKLLPGDIFLAYPGATVDGRDYVEQAIAAGAVAILVERDDHWCQHRTVHDVPIIVVDNLRQQLSVIAGRCYDHPSQDLSLIGVTGTNGKTSCSHLIMQLVNALEQSCAVMGTLGKGVDGVIQASGMIQPGCGTTPDAVSIQQCLAQWRDQGIRTVVMEVSSHGLDQCRTDGLLFNTALFTNLSRDHLDYHGSMEAYFSAKIKLFQQKGLQRAFINSDDPYSAKLLAAIPKKVECICYSLSEKKAGKKADMWVENPIFTAHGVTALLHSPWGVKKLQTPLLGFFNLSHLLVAIGSLAALGFCFDQLVDKAAKVHTIPGRMQRVKPWVDIDVVVDYAHTPAALEAALQVMRLHGDGTLWCVFGCGGERDKGKRAEMGKVAEELADQVVVTSDNPRDESPQVIIDDILGGFSQPPRVELDRARAIASTIERAAPGDHILIAGRGHETYQQNGEECIAFDDVQHAHWALASRVQ